MEHCLIACLNSGTLALLMVLFAVIHFQVLVQQAFHDTYARLDSICYKVNTTLFQVKRIPDTIYLQTLDTLQITIENTRKILLVLVSVSQSTLLWTIGVYKSGYRCLLALAINTLLSLATQLAEPLQQVANTLFDGVKNSMEAITTPLNVLFGSNVHIPHLNAPTSNWTSSLETLRSTVHDWTTDSTLTDTLVEQPFEEMKRMINTTMRGWDLLMIRPLGNTMETTDSVCHPEAVKQRIALMEDKMAAFIWTMIIAIAIAMVLCTMITFVHYGCCRFMRQQRHTTQVCSPNTMAPTPTEMHRVHLGCLHHKPLDQKPFTLYMPKRIKHESLHGLMHKMDWWMGYLGNSRSLYLLGVSLFGLFVSYWFQWILKEHIHQQAHAVEEYFRMWTTNMTSDAIQMVYHQTEQDLYELNLWISDVETDINKHTFGFIQSIALSLNTTIAGVVSHVHTFIESTFGDTFLAEPVQDVIQCLVLVKLENIERGLTWIIQHAHIDLARVNIENVLQPYISHLNSQDNALSIFSSETPQKILSPLLLNMEARIQTDIRFYWILLGLWGLYLGWGILLFMFRVLQSKKRQSLISFCAATPHTPSYQY
ncbi:hypothetical protein BDF14DRAFT_1232026 [Spinellus fusiger]|nr:hypothetical protein BDF14DRAFT_1232026 [Spinellus fusiger]